jgi:hypothetical protein
MSFAKELAEKVEVFHDIGTNVSMVATPSGAIMKADIISRRRQHLDVYRTACFHSINQELHLVKYLTL